MILKYYQKLDDAISYLLASSLSEKKLLKKILNKKILTIVDIGANEGSYIDFLSENFKLKKIYCFEPLKQLTEKIKNKYNSHNLKIYNIALSNRKAKRNFFEYYVTSNSSLYKRNNIYKSLRKLKSVKKVNTNTYDNIIGTKQKIDVCKIDAEGEDYKILLGMKKNLKKKNIKLLKVELLFKKLNEKTNETFYDILFLLKKYNYKLISISKIKQKDEKIIFINAYFAQ